MEIEGGGGNEMMWVKVGVFLAVQALIYFILSKTSNIFSLHTPPAPSFKTARTLSIRRIMAALSDFPASAGEPYVPSSDD